MATLVKTRDGRLQAQIRLADGSRRRMPKGGFRRSVTEPEARKQAELWENDALAKELRRAPKPKRAQSDTGNGPWFDAWIAARQNRGIRTRENEQAWRLHMVPVIGDKHVSKWTADELDAISEALDAKVQSGAMSWKTAQNVWGAATKMCADAYKGKPRSLRCRKDNPALGVAGPDRGEQTAKQFLYPSELSALASCDEVPLAWRRLVVLAAYTYLRPGELRALRWLDVDLEHGSLHIHRTYDEKRGKVKPTKTKHARRVPIEPTLLPLLRLLHAERGERELVVDFPRWLATPLREHLMTAGVDRSELHEKGATTKRMTFYDLRATGITWKAIRGDEPLRIQQHAGHTMFTTTQGYIRTAESMGADFGEPFPALPASVLNPVAPAECVHTDLHTLLQGVGKTASPAGFEPALLA